MWGLFSSNQIALIFSPSNSRPKKASGNTLAYISEKYSIRVTVIKSSKNILYVHGLSSTNLPLLSNRRSFTSLNKALGRHPLGLSGRPAGNWMSPFRFHEERGKTQTGGLIRRLACPGWGGGTGGGASSFQLIEGKMLTTPGTEAHG